MMLTDHQFQFGVFRLKYDVSSAAKAQASANRIEHRYRELMGQWQENSLRPRVDGCIRQ